jgi:hypothetical protein
MKNVIFIHCGNMLVDKYGVSDPARCQNIINELTSYIQDSGIVNDVERVYLEVVGSPDIQFDVPKSIVTFNGNASGWEFPTIEKIINFSKEHEDYNILYLHTKGSSTSTDGPHAEYADDIRNYHFYWLVHHYKQCLVALETSDVVGAELQMSPCRHYSHNMWWARASHINKLKHPLEYPLIYDERHQAEFWIGRDETSTYHKIYGLYDTHADAISYKKHLYRTESYE